MDRLPVFLSLLSIEIKLKLGKSELSDKNLLKHAFNIYETYDKVNVNMAIISPEYTSESEWLDACGFTTIKLVEIMFSTLSEITSIPIDQN